MNKSKDIETHLIYLMSGNKLSNKDKYEIAAYKIYENLLFKGINNFQNIHKPKTKGKKRGSEPKTDICFECNGKKYRLSIKLDTGAYIVSCNSESEFINIFLNMFNGESILDDETIDSIRKTATMISKIPNFYSFDSNYGDDLESFIRDKFKLNDKVKKWTTSEKIDEYADYIISCYSNQKLKDQYIETLHEREPFLQKTLRMLFERYPDYSKKIIFELITGSKKFGGGDCMCDCIADSDGFYLLDGPDCEYVNMKYESFMNSLKIGRLQNVPRKNIRKKDFTIGDKDLIAKSFSVADLTFKL
jgi:hypothetical protein